MCIYMQIQHGTYPIDSHGWILCLNFIWDSSSNNKSLAVVWKLNLEAVSRRCSSKYVFLKILQIFQENTCAGVSFIKLQATGPALATLIKRDSNTGVFL